MKLEIIIGSPFSADFTVVSSDGVTAEVLDPTDTAVFHLSTSGEEPTRVLEDIALTLQDADNGIFNLSLSSAQTSDLVHNVGFSEDRYPSRSMYIGLLEFTLASGDRIATVDMSAKKV